MTDPESALGRGSGMTALAGTLFTVGADGQNRAKQRSHYEKSTARKSRWLDTRLFAGSGRKLIARQRAMCVSRRAGRFGGRVCQFDARMQAIRRRTTTVQTANVCNVSYRSPLVTPSYIGGDHPKPQDCGGKISKWSPGQPQSAFYRVAKKKEESKRIPQYNKNSRFGGDRVTTPGYTTSPSCGFRRSPLSAGGLTTPDHPRGVTL